MKRSIPYRLCALFSAWALCLCLMGCGGETDVKERLQAAAGQQGASSAAESGPQQDLWPHMTPQEAAALRVGSWEGSAYTNEWAGLQFTLPDGWAILTAEQIAGVIGAGVEAISDGFGGELDPEATSASISETDTYAFYVMHAGADATFFLDILDRQAAGLPDLTPEEYLRQCIALLDRMDNAQVEAGEIEPAEFCGQQGFAVDFDLTLEGGATARQSYFTFERERYLATYVLSAVGEEGAAAAQALTAGFAALPPSGPD